MSGRGGERERRRAMRAFLFTTKCIRVNAVSCMHSNNISKNFKLRNKRLRTEDTTAKQKKRQKEDINGKHTKKEDGTLKTEHTNNHTYVRTRVNF